MSDNAKLIEAFSHIMASGALHYAGNHESFKGSLAPLNEHFLGMAADLMKYRPSVIDDLKEALK